ncbi:MAG: primosomal protein N' [Culturomica sp.]|jgi:primosomal protein N' (replication factor Y)|nr:primosomal protein N' [Culturomica sp.]
MFADLIVSLAVNGVYTYSVPDELKTSLKEGMLVMVPFGSTKRCTALVLKVHEKRPTAYETKEILCLADGQIQLSKEYVKFLLWVGEYYMCTSGEVLRAALPIVLRKTAEHKHLQKKLKEEEICLVDSQPLSDVQQSVFTDIKRQFDSNNCVLFNGVTSSGKTEIYIHLIKEYINNGRQVLYMLPEIALTIQIVGRLKRVFGDKIAVYHSGITDAKRAELWRKQCGEEPYPVILGVRSSIFLPFKNLGLVIIDEEHDRSYKQQEPSPRYNGRDAAIMAANLYGAKTLLGSATPSFESYENAMSGKYGYVELNVRYGNVVMPKIILADLAEYRRRKLMNGNFTPLLRQAMEDTLKEGKQVILFQNRKGYSSYLQCDECGGILKCKTCDVSMTYYKKRNVMSCRYCGRLREPIEICETCGSGRYRLRTPGTEKIEEEVSTLFPDVTVARMDLETMSNKSKYEAIIKDFSEGSIKVLIGTQMVAKGFDFENVKLVGILDGDNILNFPDFRSEERAYSMFMQVSGRSGRKKEQGMVVVQTAEKDNRVYRSILNGSYSQFFSELSEERKHFGYPPFFRLIDIELRHMSVVILRNAANGFAKSLRTQLGRRIMGPAEPEVSKINRFNRIQILVKIEHNLSISKVKDIIKKEITALTKQKEYQSLRIICDVDC